MTATAASARNLVYQAAQHKSHLYLAPDDVTALWDSIMADAVRMVRAENRAETLKARLTRRIGA